MISLPPAFTERMQQLLGNESETFFQALVSESPTSIRLNPEKTANTDLPFSELLSRQVPWCSNGYYLKERPSFTSDPLLHGGAYYVQEASSMFLQVVLQQITGDTPLRVLDLCAAPGGKSTLLANNLPKDSLLVSNEVIKSRASILKENIIILLDFTDTAGKQMLQSIACEKDDMLAFQAIKKLNKFDSESAIDISKNILETYKTQTPEKVNAALKVMSEVYREARIQKAFTKRLELEKAAFIDLCSNIINTSEAGDKLQDCAILALSDMTDAQAITTIVENPNIDNSFKVYAIDQNYLTLTAMAESGSEEAIDIVCKAMEINPLKELSEPLSACQVTPMTRSANAVSEKTVKKANAAASRIALTGTNANPRWAQFYNEVN